MSGLHTFAGQFFSAICATYSSLKYLMVDSTGLGRVCPRPHIEASLIASPSSSRNATSPSRPFPSEILVRTSSRASLPSRHALHLPQDSSLVNWMKNFETSTMQVSSSITIIPPEPIIEPTSFRPVLLIFPTSEKILVPLLVAVPMPANHSAPRVMITGTFASVSTLLMTVGQP